MHVVDQAVTPTRTWRFCAGSLYERETWMATLETMRSTGCLYDITGSDNGDRHHQDAIHSAESKLHTVAVADKLIIASYATGFQSACWI